MKQYKYTLLGQDGSMTDLGTFKREKPLSYLYNILDCDFVEVIPSAYFEKRGYGNCVMWGDEEGRFKETNKRNPFFDVLRGDPTIGEPREWDVVGNIIKQERVE